VSILHILEQSAHSAGLISLPIWSWSAPFLIHPFHLYSLVLPAIPRSILTDQTGVAALFTVEACWSTLHPAALRRFRFMQTPHHFVRIHVSALSILLKMQKAMHGNSRVQVLLPVQRLILHPFVTILPDNIA